MSIIGPRETHDYRELNLGVPGLTYSKNHIQNTKEQVPCYCAVPYSHRGGNRLVRLGARHTWVVRGDYRGLYRLYRPSLNLTH